MRKIMSDSDKYYDTMKNSKQSDIVQLQTEKMHLSWALKD